MRRRDLLAFSAATAALGAHGAIAQRRMRRVGVLLAFTETDPTTRAIITSFAETLGRLGWVEGKTLSIDYRFAAGDSALFKRYAAELVNFNPDAILASTPPAVMALREQTRTIPIVFVLIIDPVEQGFVQSLARPGGNITGLDQIAPELGGRLELLKETVPKLSRVVVLWNPQNQTSTRNWNELQDPARQLGLALHSLEVRNADELDKALNVATSARADALAMLPDPVFVANLKRIADFAAKDRLPSIFHLREFADAGGLITYGPDRSDLFRRAAAYIDKILKGAKPADLPIQLPTKFELVVNLKTAKAIGLELPPTLIARADEVIE
jgi:ABC-type uncharacterized transport system substrate-binding protein